MTTGTARTARQRRPQAALSGTTPGYEPMIAAKRHLSDVEKICTAVPLRRLERLVE